MYCRRAIFLLLLVFFGFFSSPAYAQFNLKTGYNISILSNPGLNRMISDFNQSQSYSSPFHDLSWLHGYEAGLRLKTGIHAFELTYQQCSKKFKSTGLIPGGTSKYKDYITYTVQSGALGYQLGNRVFGMGTDLQYQFYEFTYEDGIAKSSTKNHQHMMALKFYMMLTFGSDNGIDFAIQPYMILPTKYYDLLPLSEILKTENTGGKDKWIRYGLTILFYNGEK